MIDAAAHLGLARLVTQRLAPAWRGVLDREDAEGWAVVGLVEAARRYDPSRGLAFSTYAVRRASGTLLDAVRRARGGRHWGAYPQPLLLSLSQLRTPDGATLADVLADPADELGEHVAALDGPWLRAALASLPERPRAVYDGLARGRTQHEIARAMGVSDSLVNYYRNRWRAYLLALLRGGSVEPPRMEPGRRVRHRGPARQASVVPLVLRRRAG